MTAHRFYIATRSLWQNDIYRPVAGPFPTRKRAEQHISEYACDGIENGSQNLRNVITAVVVSHTTLVRKWKMDEGDIINHIYLRNPYNNK